MAAYVGARYGCVYALIDTRFGTTRYVGQSSKPAARLRGHIRDAYHCRRDRRPTHCMLWLRGLLEAGYEPLMIILEEGEWTADQVNEAEIRWIARYDTLTNITKGGNGGAYVVRPEHRTGMYLRDPEWRKLHLQHYVPKEYCTYGKRLPHPDGYECYCYRQLQRQREQELLPEWVSIYD